ncbi:MAG TPA: DUF2259 domain-containing protein [Devosiaceae bacterium]|jgi:predicted secreted protein|nr:DUF2259 domain-containing protein [Devosiaceae bacterium]
MRRLLEVLAVCAALLCSVLPAMAGDRAIFAPLGYSADSRYFAFEEFGAGEGGLPYSSVYVLDLSSGDLVKGAPFQARAAVDLSDVSLASIRGEAARAAAATLKQLGIENPAEYRVLLGDGVSASDGKSLNWSTPDCCMPGTTQGEVSTLSLATFAMPKTPQCANSIGKPSLGFALSLSGREIYRDKSLPKSRGCTVDYRLYAVLAPYQGKGGLVAIVAYYPYGFHGADRRFLAVPLGQ